MVSSILSIVSVIAVIIILVVAHELGHFIAAKLCGMRVEEFAVGFGPKKLRLLKRNGTEYNLRPIPAGGFVRIAGMDPSEEGPPDGFNAQSVWKRMIVIFAGPFASFMFAYAVFCSLGITVGLPIGQPTIARIAPGTPAQQVGLKSGDRFLEIAGEKVKTGEQMMKAIRSHPGQKIKIVIERDGKQITLFPTARRDKEGNTYVGRLGFTPGAALQRVSLVQSIAGGTTLSFELVKRLVGTIFSKRIAQDAGGPIAIIAATHQAAKAGFAELAILTAGLSLNFAVLNLLPIPLLDGGLLLLLLIELVRRRRLSAKAQQAALTMGFAVLAVIVVLVLAKDISGLGIFSKH